MKIGELARAAKTSVETIRYYEKIGLLTKAERDFNNYRYYNDAHAARLIFIRNCRLLGLNHQEIRALIDLNTAGSDTCADTLAILSAHLEHIKIKIAHLKELEKKIKAMQKECRRLHQEQSCRVTSPLEATPMDIDIDADKMQDLHQPDQYLH